MLRQRGGWLRGSRDSSPTRAASQNSVSRQRFFDTALYLKLSKCAEVGQKYFVEEKVTILKNLGVLDVGRWIGGASWAVWGKGRVSYLAGPCCCFTTRVTTTWLTSIGPPTGRSARDGPIPRELLGHHPIRGRDGQMKRRFLALTVVGNQHVCRLHTAQPCMATQIFAMPKNYAIGKG